MAESSEETPVTGNKEEEVVKLSNTVRGACVLARAELIRNVILFALSVFFIHKHGTSNLPTDIFLLYNVWFPLFVFNMIMIVCSIYYIFALTQSTVRYLYIEVFYINIFRKLVVIFFCIYMLVVIFSPHTFNVSTSTLKRFDNAYLIFTAAILSYALFDSSLVISYICALFFRAHRVRNFLSKYWFVRLIVIVIIDLLLVGFYTHCLIVHPFNFIYLIYLILVLTKALILIWFLKKEVCVPMSWKLKPLDDQKVPDSYKVRQAVKIMAMKAEVKEIADGAGAA